MYRECSTEKCGNVVFHKDLCRKHYDINRRESMPECSVDGCTLKQHAKGECDKHYRETLLSKKPDCVVPGCAEKARLEKYGLCQMHELRWRANKSVENPRDHDWGSREQHPLYGRWHHHGRSGSATMIKEWRDDFWAFAKAVGDVRHGCTLRRIDKNKPMGPRNFEWKEKLGILPSTAEYSREWRKKNPRKAKNIQLKKHHGITLEYYEEMLDSQGGVCAICEKMDARVEKDGGPSYMPMDHCHETGKIRGILCNKCNRALGSMNDDPVLLRKAADYLSLHASTGEAERLTHNDGS